VRDDACELLCLDLPKAEALRRGGLPDSIAERAARRAWAFADPTRFALAAVLREGGELCVCDLAWIAARSQNLVSHHLRALRSEGLVRSRREGKMVMYSLTEDGARLLDALVRDPVAALA
jgi:DNA-binding transcriptional ArsR family regulator